MTYLSPDSQSFIKNGFWTLFARGFGSAISFLVILIIARLLGPADFGIFSLCLTIVTIIAVLSKWGLDIVVLKQVATNMLNNLKKAKGYIVSSFAMVLCMSFIVALTIWLIMGIFSEYFIENYKISETLLIFIWSIIPLSLIVILGEAYKSCGRPVLATSLQTVIAPLLILIMIGVLLIFEYVSLSSLVFVYVMGLFIALFFSIFAWIKVFPKSKVDIISFKQLFLDGWPILIVTSSVLVMNWTDIIILGVFVTEEELGVYYAASRVALASTLVLVAVNSINAPKFAKFYEKGDFDQISEIAQQASVVLLAIVSVPSFLFVIFPEWVMSWFGGSYSTGAGPLTILAIGQYVNVVCGSVGYLLTMTGKEKTLRNIILVSAAVNIVLNLFFVQLFGMLGVSYATAISIILWNIWALCEVKKHLGFWTITPFVFSKIKYFMRKNKNFR